MTDTGVETSRPRALPPRAIDARESEDWFLRLPEAKQQQLRDYWDDRLLDGPRFGLRQRDRARRLALEAAVVLCVPLFLVNALLAGPLATLLLLAIGAPVGAGVGLAVHAIRGGRFAAAGIGTAAWLLVQLGGGAVRAGGSINDAPPLLFLFLGVWMTACLFAAWGQRLEFRTLEGTD